MEGFLIVFVVVGFILLICGATDPDGPKWS